MRTHRVFSGLQPWAWRSALLRELVSAAHLTAVRIEPVTRGREPSAFVDLHFTDGEGAVTVPLVYLDLAQLDIRESDPLVFPHAVLGCVSEPNVREIVELLYPVFERRAMTGGFRAEEVLRFGDCARFDAARERGFFGAAPLARALPRIAPAVYARRFAPAKHVLVYGPAARELAGFLAGPASGCSVLDDDDADALAWYGPFDGGTAEESYDLALGRGPSPAKAAVCVRTDDGSGDGVRIPVVAPLPADVLISFDPADGPPAAAFAVTAVRESYGRPQPDIEIAPAAGGSSGKVAVVVRPDAGIVSDADTDEAAALAEALRREGFTVEVVHNEDALAAFEPDLVHLYGVRPGGFARRIAEWTADHRRPLAVHALHEAPDAGGYWGAMVAPYCFSYSADDRSVGTYLDMLARRAVEVDGVGAGAPHAPAIAGLPDSERVLALADVVFVNSERERAVIERLRPRRPTFVVPPVPSAVGAGRSVAEQTGTDPFVLVHAPVWPEANQLLLARAAGEVGVPMVIAGPVADPVYAERLREFAPDLVYVLGEPATGEVATLYRSAAVIADAAWTARGHARLVTAAALGAAAVVSQTRWVDLPEGGFWTVDPADFRSIARGIGEAWDAAVRGDDRIRETAKFARERLRAAAQGIVAAYAKIVQAL